jgi:hypothetical protein
MPYLALKPKETYYSVKRDLLQCQTSYRLEGADAILSLEVLAVGLDPPLEVVELDSVIHHAQLMLAVVLLHLCVCVCVCVCV